MPNLTLKTRLAHLPKQSGAGPLIREAMQRTGLSLADVAKKTGLTKRRVDQLRRDVRFVTVRDAQLLSEALGINTISLFAAQMLRNHVSMAVSDLNRNLNRQFSGKA